ncbi:protein of unknown function [Streptomyces sp. KY75]|nr:protein of unknown function [Streptomyces sp. KY75]CAD5982961.1 protein of unknown function [Streptomyces sp. KY70]
MFRPGGQDVDQRDEQKEAGGRELHAPYAALLLLVGGGVRERGQRAGPGRGTLPGTATGAGTCTGTCTSRRARSQLLTGPGPSPGPAFPGVRVLPWLLHRVLLSGTGRSHALHPSHPFKPIRPFQPFQPIQPIQPFKPSAYASPPRRTHCPYFPYSRAARRVPRGLSHHGTSTIITRRITAHAQAPGVRPAHRPTGGHRRTRRSNRLRHDAPLRPPPGPAASRRDARRGPQSRRARQHRRELGRHLDHGARRPGAEHRQRLPRQHHP